MTRELQLYGNKVYGFEVSSYGLENGYLDYATLAKIVGDCVLNNSIFEFAGYENWELESGEEENEYGDYLEVYQYYIITYSEISSDAYGRNRLLQRAARFIFMGRYSFWNGLEPRINRY